MTVITMSEKKTEAEILDDLRDRGIARPIPTNDTAGDPCPVCTEPIPEHSHKTLNLGLPDYCSLACRLEAEDGTESEDSV